MNIEQTKKGVLLKECEDFDIRHTFDCGQCFRFHEQEDGAFCGVAFGKQVRFRQQNNNIQIEGVTPKDFENDFRHFLDLDRDYRAIKQSFAKDEVLNRAITHGAGIRILKQEFFECLISFILSQQNNIPKIKKAVEGFAERFGEKLESDGTIYYKFPTPWQLRDLKSDDLSFLKIGYRDKYLIDAIRKINEECLNPKDLETLGYEEAKQKLMTINGVGQKVADCILLFSLGRFDAFPVDTWMKKAMLALYGIGEKAIPAYSKEHFGQFSGFAQQYIFYYARSLKLQADQKII